MKPNSNFYAVIIGFNQFRDKGKLPDLQFAEKDARDLYGLLTDEHYGRCPAKNVTLITGTELRMQLEDGKEYADRTKSLAKGDIPIEQIETEDIETILYTQVVNNRTPNDVVLVYYSGHGFIAGKHEKAYLATPDVSILSIKNNPMAGLKMEYLHNDIFMDTKAKFVIFLLDCCHSGAFCTHLEHKEQSDLKQLVEARFYSGEGRVAFVSSPHNIISRESKDFKNGVFTYHMLNGLRGGAIEPTGEVTIASLVSYVQRMSPLSQPPVLYGNTTRVVLTKPSIAVDQGYRVIPATQLRPSAGDDAEPKSLTNPLESHIEFANTMIECLKGIELEGNKSLGDRILSSLRCSLDAEFAFVERIEEHDSEKNIIYRYQSDLNMKGTNLDEYKSLMVNELYSSLVRKKKELLPERYGFAKPFSGRKDSDKYLVAIPLRLEYPREFLILSGVDAEKLKPGEIMGRVLITVYASTRELTSLNQLDIENAIFDDIKQDFGHVPSSIYAKRFELFRKKLQDVTFDFEPVVQIAKVKPEIVSWEALARDPLTKKAPTDLFKAAELWGPQFITELDLYCLRNAIGEYVGLWEETYPGRRPDQLSVNVYPDTLFRSAYKNELFEIFKAETIKSDQLVIEISEKRPIPSVEQIREHVLGYFDPVEEFIKRLGEYTSEMQVNFAIDDFGIGQSSVSRLAKLGLNHIKIDRDVLLHAHPECTIEYVMNIVKAAHPQHSFDIIVEGFDGASRIPLKKLADLGIRYIQGHMIRRALHSVSNLSREEKELITSELARKDIPDVDKEID